MIGQREKREGRHVRVRPQLGAEHDRVAIVPAAFAAHPIVDHEFGLIDPRPELDARQARAQSLESEERVCGRLHEARHARRPGPALERGIELHDAGMRSDPGHEGGKDAWRPWLLPQEPSGATSSGRGLAVDRGKRQARERSRPRRRRNLAMKRPAAVGILTGDEPAHPTVRGRPLAGVQTCERQRCERRALGVTCSTAGRWPASVMILSAKEHGHGLADHRDPPARSDQLTPSGKRNLVTMLPLALWPLNQSSCSHRTPCGSSTRATRTRWIPSTDTAGNIFGPPILPGTWTAGCTGCTGCASVAMDVSTNV